MALNRWALAPIAIVYNAQASEGRFNLFFIRLTSLVSIRSFPSKRFTSRRFTSRGFQLYGLSTLGAFSSICLNTHISEWKTWHSQQSNFYFSKALFSSVHLLFEETPFLSIQRINKNSLYESNFYFSQESIIFINRNNSLHEFQLYFRLGCVIFKIHNVHVLWHFIEVNRPEVKTSVASSSCLYHGQVHSPYIRVHAICHSCDFLQLLSWQAMRLQMP